MPVRHGPNSVRRCEIPDNACNPPSLDFTPNGSARRATGLATLLTFYGYAKCSTCRNAKRELTARGLQFDEIDITRRPPPRALLQAILRSRQYRLPDLLNRSGQLYRSMNLKAKLPTLTESDLLDLLARHGRLLKRPIVTDGARHTVGFDRARFEAVWGQGGS